MGIVGIMLDAKPHKKVGRHEFLRFAGVFVLEHRALTLHVKDVCILDST